MPYLLLFLLKLHKLQHQTDLDPGVVIVPVHLHQLIDLLDPAADGIDVHVQLLCRQRIIHVVFQIDLQGVQQLPVLFRVHERGKIVQQQLQFLVRDVQPGQNTQVIVVQDFLIREGNGTDLQGFSSLFREKTNIFIWLPSCLLLNRSGRH